MAKILFLDGVWSENAVMREWLNQLGTAPASNLLNPQPSIVWDSWTQLPSSNFYTSSFMIEGSDEGYDGVVFIAWEVTPESFFRVKTGNTRAAFNTGGTVAHDSGNRNFHIATGLSNTY